MPCCAISEEVYCRVRWCIIGVVGACLPLVSTRFTFASQVCSCDFVLWDRRLYFATCLPLVYRFFSCLRRNWDRIFPLLYLLLVSHLSFASVSVLSLKWKTWFVYRWTPPFSHFRLCAAAFGLLFVFQFLWLFPFLHVYGLMAGTNSAPDVSFFCLGSALYNFCYLLLVAGGMEWMVPSSFCGCISPLLCLLLLIYALPSFIISLNLYPCVVAPHQHLIFATWAERMVVISCNATRIDFYVASSERPRKNFLVRSLSLNISSPACVWLLGGSVACSGEVGQGPVNYCPAFCIPLRLVCLLGPVRQKEGRETGLVFPHLPVKVSRF